LKNLPLKQHQKRGSEDKLGTGRKIPAKRDHHWGQRRYNGVLVKQPQRLKKKPSTTRFQKKKAKPRSSSSKDGSTQLQPRLATTQVTEQKKKKTPSAKGNANDERSPHRTRAQMGEERVQVI